MASIRVISTSTIQATNHGDLTQKIDLTLWDVLLLHIEPIQQGLLFPKPKAQDISNQIHHLKRTLSSTLTFFPPLTGRLIITEHENNTSSVFITCNNAGALFLHAVAPNTSVNDILKPNNNYVPPIVHSFFPLNGVKNHQGTSHPLLAVQVTELLDGTFIGCAFNHVVADGKSFWHFINSWAEISRSLDKPTKLPSSTRFFPDSVDIPIRFPFTNEEESFKPQPPPIRIFHFTKEKIAELKSKANTEAAGIEKINNINISSLQALLTHIWRSVIRGQGLDPQEETKFSLPMDFRTKMCPPLVESYFGNIGTAGVVRMKAGELLMEGGLGKGALEMNKTIHLQSQMEVFKSGIEGWLNAPFLIRAGMSSRSIALLVNSSSRFNYYGNDFGWGKPLAVRNGPANKTSGKVTVVAGAEEGSIDVELCLPYEILEAMGNDPEFIHFVSM